MTIAEDLIGTVAPTSVVWSEVEPGFHVASRSGEFVGSVDTTGDGHFVGFDGTSTPIGRFASLAEARSAVVSWKAPRQIRLERRLGEFFMRVATATGIIAGLTAVAGSLLTLAR